MQKLVQILEDINSVVVDTSSMTEDSLVEFRKHLNRIDAACGEKMSQTSTKDHDYNDTEVKEYIEDILEDGFNLQDTKLSDYPKFVDAQKLRKWDALISACVDASDFSAKKFKIHSLRLLRSNIAQSKTLHELRRSVNLMISPLQLWRDHEETCKKFSRSNLAKNDKEIDDYVDKILIENESLRATCNERKRVLDELIGFYDEGLSDVAMLRNCEAAKTELGLSDDEVAKMFGTNRKKLQRLRKEIEVTT